MLELGQTMGRQEAHDLVYEAVERSTRRCGLCQCSFGRQSNSAHLNDEGVKALLTRRPIRGFVPDGSQQRARLANLRKVLQRFLRLDLLGYGFRSRLSCRQRAN